MDKSITDHYIFYIFVHCCKFGYCSFLEIFFSEIEFLGGTVDSKLKFKNHTSSTCRKVSRQVAVLQRIYLSLVHSNFNYCSEVWNQFSKKGRDKLEKK